MKTHRKELWFLIPARRQFLNITSQVQEAVSESAVQQGLVLVNAMHITASVFINDDESGLHEDYDRWLERLAPHAPTTRTNITAREKTTRMLTSSAKSWAEK